jgi:hypothetical protein
MFDDGARERNQAPSLVLLEQLRERQKELEEALLQLEVVGAHTPTLTMSTGGSSKMARDPCSSPG